LNKINKILIIKLNKINLGEKEEWILATIVKVLDDEGMYEVEDDDVGLDVEITPVIKRLVLSPSCVIPLPDDTEKSLPKGLKLQINQPNKQI